MPFDEDSTPKLKIRSTKEIKYFASRHSSVRFCYDNDKIFIGFNVREQHELGKPTSILHPKIMLPENVLTIETNVKITSEGVLESNVDGMWIRQRKRSCAKQETALNRAK